ncbi:MAG: Asp-tRNA(Asn)/Glu-tRNA(Gln) amidotransferase GatCAB subunit B, partial [Myxococcales bacterium]|nr:Asp-tRNA(Asn)/Glu-tRNA(Gln) amidotransferase GatCAB subunit B [Myxococcales bacterium]
MFSACPVGLLAEPNTLVDPYTLGLPGTLPVANAAAVAMAIRVALALGGDVQAESRWARKHYFYPDLPKGYQITQSDHPYCRGGALEVPGPKGREDEVTRVRLIRVHMEEDAGKSSHAPGEPWSLVDYNRAGAPLLEIVSEPDLRGAGEAARYLRELRAIIRALDVSDANMEEGTLRCDANVSLRPRGSDVLGARCEIKNL